MPEPADDGDARLPVPDSLLAPLLDAAATVLHGLEAAAVPPVLRTLAGFDRRGLASGTARSQLRRAFEIDEDFRSQVVDEFRTRAEVAAALDTWSAPGALRRVEDAAERADLPLLASALYATRPDGWEFGLGVVCSAAERKRSDKERDDEARALEVQLTNLDEARRRAEGARDDARDELKRVEQQLRDERGARRDRESKAGRDAETAEQRAREAEAALAKARAAGEMAESRLAREADRAREAERRLRELRRELADREDGVRAAGAELGDEQLAKLGAAADRARELAAELDGLVRSAEPRRPAAEPSGPGAAGDAPAGAGAATRRVAPHCPPGMRADTAEALDSMLRTRGVLLVVDGYNVSMAGWPGASAAEQRDRLVSGLSALHLRLRCDSVAVFDGADVEGVAPPRRPGVRVVFSDAEEGADPLVVREAAAPAPDVPVVVASSDAWVRQESERTGAVVVPGPTLLEVLRR
jgi:predicted RNA-binding protein with PIN domain